MKPDHTETPVAALTEAAHYLAAPLSAPVEVHPAEADAPAAADATEEGFPDPLGKAKAAVPGRPAIWLEMGDGEWGKDG